MHGVDAQRAFTLLEALIALLVLSVGLLGMASLQLESLRGAHLGYQRGLASLAAQDAVELLWSRLEAGGCPRLGAAEAAWQDRWQEHLPGLQGEVSALGGGCRYRIRLEWSGAAREAATTLVYRARLPEVSP
ncbi:prepilin-type N-terminal cleavage/methylation domain-containing protein [Halomonas sp. 18H]|uniref:type IV pilus modification PilV family protein n=1 Tax=Halomonas almeriensis TaxID=308163 RepID=UPI00223071BA|nr:MULTISPECIES: prepilin-type N-terminal cleavage/methylation domain-containing protein [Halomonas]MCW4149760.1 prepilin-type N-terminal cleavage/methylation domain-containing protein [Halomonas sp. 18H]MDN3553296.1 prepilin-type N-terminal cleavage/methylation domain-containing protein [Halomonas almeriensis]